MKKGTKAALLAAAILIMAGLVITVVALALGANYPDVMTSGLFSYSTMEIHSDAPSSVTWNSEISDDGVYLVTESVGSMDVQWVAGNAEVKVGEKGLEHIIIQETSTDSIDKDSALRYGILDGTLYIEYCSREGKFTDLPTKNLIITIPQELAEQMDSLRFDGISSSLNLDGVTVSTLECSSTSGALTADHIHVTADSKLSTTSGNISFSGNFHNLTAESVSGLIELDCEERASGEVYASSTSGTAHVAGFYHALSLSTTSGDIEVNATADSIEAESLSGAITLNGGFGDIDAETTSGNIEIRSDVAVKELDVETTSGHVGLTIPKTSDFTLNFDTVSGSLDSELTLSMQGGTLFCGNGDAEYDVSTTSGNLEIKPLKE